MRGIDDDNHRNRCREDNRDAGRLRNRAQTANAVSIIPIVSTIPIKTGNYTANVTVQGYIARYYRVLLHNTNPT